MGKKSFKKKVQDCFSPSGSPKTSAPIYQLDPAEIAEQERIEREQEEEDLRKLAAEQAQEDAKAQAQAQAEEEELKKMEDRQMVVDQQEALLDQAHANLGGQKKGSSRDRFKEREARKQAAFEASLPPPNEEEDARITREKLLEKDSLTKTCAELKLECHEISPDGHCMYSAIADQLAILGLISPKANLYQTTRHAAADYIASHPDDFIPFLAAAGGEDTAGALDDGMLDAAGLKEYTDRVRESGDWGGEPEILALSRHYNIPIHVIQQGPPTIVAHAPGPEGSGTITVSEARATRSVKISFHTKMYGLGAHYSQF
ncbi:OTU (ovarian tumor)-like cysteine protease [Phaffia rhodozyma]|uniref:OTU (Ovarian tumor)-like cysteine protease n=1 Tax=Phaffia rhodozyma TaxID=264483 RepID=A0A0F7SUI4_PHARH|nr:OTU (ovarian tumor)-like cysteine protease [Phaffia rhodozyma]